jgi:Cu+-exporting ATPase
MSEHSCIHCGEDCGKSPVVWQEKPFCCEGCKTVYQLLNENKLENYYTMYDNPGIKVEVQDYGNKYAWLDKQEVIDKVVYFTEGEYSKVKLYIPDIHCSSCIWLLENLYQLNPNITQSMVNFVKKEVDITYKNSAISLRQIVELLASIHYIPMINLESVTNEAHKQQNKKLIYKLGIAGFAFGNTMLLSMPEYIPGEVSPEFRSFFGYLNMFLAIPVLLYSASDYILSAYKNLRHKIINIDFPITLGIFTIFFQSSYEIISGNGTGYMDSLCGLVFFCS